MIANEFMNIINELIPVYKQFITGKYAIALAGSHAKGTADLNSDLDIFIYTEDILPYSARKTIIEGVADSVEGINISEAIDRDPWGGCIDFKYMGHDIETTVHSLSYTENTLNECLQGNIAIHPAFWTLNGYYSYICLAEIDFIKALEDPYNIISDFKNKVSQYPPRLKKAIIDEFWWRCNMWLDNFHYASAIKRMDIIYTSGCVQSTFHAIVQLLFALNEKYFNGDKKIEKQLAELEFCPKCLTDNIGFLLNSPRDVDMLQQQREILICIVNEIKSQII